MTDQQKAPSLRTRSSSVRIPGFTRLSSQIYNLKYALLDNSTDSLAMTKSPALQSNLDVDYVISYRFAKTDKAKAIAQFEKLCEALANVGLQTEVRNGDSHSVLLFVRVASDKHLYGEVYRSR
jgi:hypothetical protein|tara:strand:+ start:21998 stop:22366 length:369 start_codon:yes stop_codon:yes gene_type:complete